MFVLLRYTFKLYTMITQRDRLAYLPLTLTGQYFFALHGF